MVAFDVAAGAFLLALAVKRFGSRRSGRG
jgi:hypothetical protein